MLLKKVELDYQHELCQNEREAINPLALCPNTMSHIKKLHHIRK